MAYQTPWIQSLRTSQSSFPVTQLCLLLSSHTGHLLAFQMPRHTEFLPAPGLLDLLLPSNRKSLPTALYLVLSLIHVSNLGGAFPNHPSISIHFSYIIFLDGIYHHMKPYYTVTCLLTCGVSY